MICMQLPPLCKFKILHHGKVIYCENKSLYTMRIYKEYAKLNEEREIILQSIKKRGDIYGS